MEPSITTARESAKTDLLYKLFQLNHEEMAAVLIEAVEKYPFIEGFLNRKIKMKNSIFAQWGGIDKKSLDSLQEELLPGFQSKKLRICKRIQKEQEIVAKSAKNVQKLPITPQKEEKLVSLPRRSKRISKMHKK